MADPETIRLITQPEVLAASLGMYSAFAGPSLPDLPTEPESPDHVDVDLGIAVLSRWPIRHSWVHALPTSREVAPVAIVTAIQHPRGTLYTVCTCLEYHAHLADDHLAQARELARLAADLGARGSDLPVIVLGDMNAGPDEPGIDALTGELVDAWELAIDKPRTDVDGVTLSSAVPFAPFEAVKQLDRRIDYVFIQPHLVGEMPTVFRAPAPTSARVVVGLQSRGGQSPGESANWDRMRNESLIPSLYARPEGFTAAAWERTDASKHSRCVRRLHGRGPAEAGRCAGDV